jgi:hypothetical protein
MRYAPAETIDPMMTADLEPMATAIRPDSNPKRNMVTVRGRRNNPDWMMSAPNP